MQQNGLAASEIDAPEAVLRVPKEGQPGGSTIAECYAIMLGEDVPHNVLVDVYTEGVGDEQGDPRAAESGAALESNVVTHRQILSVVGKRTWKS